MLNEVVNSKTVVPVTTDEQQRRVVRNRKVRHKHMPLDAQWDFYTRFHVRYLKYTTYCALALE